MISVLTWWRKFWNFKLCCWCICSFRKMTFVNWCQINWSIMIFKIFESEVCHNNWILIKENWWKLLKNITVEKLFKMIVKFCWSIQILLHCWLMMYNNVKLIMLILLMIIMILLCNREYVWKLILFYAWLQKSITRTLWIMCLLIL